jgi:phage/plasmid-associated DNA primase
MVAAAESMASVEDAKLDPDRWLLNVENRTLDLTTGEFLPHQARDLITKVASVRHGPDARLSSRADGARLIGSVAEAAVEGEEDAAEALRALRCRQPQRRPLGLR